MFLKVKCVKVGARDAVTVQMNIVSNELCRGNLQRTSAGSGLL